MTYCAVAFLVEIASGKERWLLFTPIVQFIRSVTPAKAGVQKISMMLDSLLQASFVTTPDKKQDMEV